MKYGVPCSRGKRSTLTSILSLQQISWALFGEKKYKCLFATEFHGNDIHPVCSGWDSWAARKKAWQREQRWQGLTPRWLSSQSPVQQRFCGEWFLGIAAPTARSKLSPCDCCDPGAASSRDALWRGSFTKWDRSYEMSAEGTKLHIPDWLSLGKDQRRWKQQRLVALLLFINKCNCYFLFTWWAKVYWALYLRCATFLCLLLICCNLFWSVTFKYYSMFCLLPCCISKAWLSRL